MARSPSKWRTADRAENFSLPFTGVRVKSAISHPESESPYDRPAVIEESGRLTELNIKIRSNTEC